MSILDSREQIAVLDKSNMIGSIEALSRQVLHAWEDTQNLTFTPTDTIKNIVVAGMGGSCLGADVIKHLFKDTLSVPFDFVNSYTLPAYANSNTLVVLASYSGTTEEVLACAQQAIDKHTQVMVIAAGGDLEELAIEKQWTYYKIVPTHNPSNQPRMAIGYAVFGMIGLLAKANLLTLSEAEIDAVTETIDRVVADNTIEVSQDESPAKALAFTILDRRPVLVASDFLSGAAHVASNQHNENAKIFMDYKLVPELNHHLMEGLRFPLSNASNHVFLFVTSRIYPPAIQARMGITRKIVESQDIETMEIPLLATTPLTQAFELISLMSFSSFYLSMLEGIDPSPIPYVDQFKEELKKLEL